MGEGERSVGDGLVRFYIALILDSKILRDKRNWKKRGSAVSVQTTGQTTKFCICKEGE